MQQEQWVYWENTLVLIVAAVMKLLAVNSIQLLQHLPYLLVLAPPYFLMFQNVKEELVGLP
jgi:hypothetical protein